MSDTSSYLIHDNGGRPFNIVIDKSNVNIHKIIEDDDDDLCYDNDYIAYEQQPLYNFKTNRIFIGNDKHVHQSEGNTILLHIRNNEYVYVGGEIYSFTSEDEITEYYSPIGNSDSPCAYGIDINGNYYLFAQHIVLINTGNLDEIIGIHSERCQLNPYSYYYWPKSGYPKAITKSMSNIEVIQKRLW